MGTFEQAVPGVVVAALGGLGGSVAVAIGALVVVLAIVLVFVMVLRSSGSARKTASGLGYDPQRGPLGQPQMDSASNSPWQRPQGQQSWQSGADFGAPPATPNPSGGPQSAWGSQQDFGPAGAGQQRWGVPGQNQPAWNEPAAQQSIPPWGAPAEQASGDQWSGQGAPWSPPQVAPSRPLPGQGAPAAQHMAPWEQQPSPAAQGRAPWEAGASNATPAPWAMPESGTPSPWGAPPQQQGAPVAPGGWNMEPATPQQEQPWNVPAANRDWGAPQGSGGYDAAAFADADKTRIARPAGPQRASVLVIRKGKEPGRIFEIVKDVMTIGRSRESDIFLEDLAVSRTHTIVERDPSGRFIVRDKESANGTYVNGQRITEHVLEEGDEVQVGQTVLAFVRR